MKARRKAPRSTASAREIERLKKANKRLRRLLKEERARWDEKCPKGHLCRHDLCTVECYIDIIDPIETPFMNGLPKVKPGELMHEWVIDKLTPFDPGEIELGKPLTPEEREKLLKDAVETHMGVTPSIIEWGKLVRDLYAQFDINLTEKQTGWWIRIPYGWWLRLKNWRKK